MTNTRQFLAFAAALVPMAAGGAASAQDLYQPVPQSAAPVMPPAPAPISAPAADAPASAGDPNPSAPQPVQPAQSPAPVVIAPRLYGAPTLSAVSLYAVEPPAPRTFAAEDLVTIIISERNKFERSQSLDTKKDYDFQAVIDEFINLQKLLELRAEAGRTREDGLPRIDLSASSDFKGEGDYEREDKMTARVQARIVEVRPNGTLLIEARSNYVTDKEAQAITLSGVCRSDDISINNTVQSNQIYDLKLDVQNTGQVKDAGKKGLIPQVIETLFNF